MTSDEQLRAVSVAFVEDAHRPYVAIYTVPESRPGLPIPSCHNSGLNDFADQCWSVAVISYHERRRPVRKRMRHINPRRSIPASQRCRTARGELERAGCVECRPVPIIEGRKRDYFASIRADRTPLRTIPGSEPVARHTASRAKKAANVQRWTGTVVENVQG